MIYRTMQEAEDGRPVLEAMQKGLVQSLSAEPPDDEQDWIPDEAIAMRAHRPRLR